MECVPSEHTAEHFTPMRPLPSRFFAHWPPTVIMVPFPASFYHSDCTNTERRHSFQMRHRSRCRSGVRSREVGVIMDPTCRKLFDHHQKSFTETFDDHHKTKLSSAGSNGTVACSYKHFGRDIIRALCPHPLSDTELQVVYRRMYDNFVEEIDGVDNGIDPFCGERNYSVTTGLSSRIKRLSIPWNRHQSEAGILRPSSEAASTLLWVEGRRTEQGLRNCKLRFRPQQRIHGHQ